MTMPCVIIVGNAFGLDLINLLFRRSRMLQAALFRLLSALTVLFCAPVSASLHDDLFNQYLPGELTELMVGEDIVPVYESPAATPLTRGVAIILADVSPLGLTFGQGKQLSDSLSEKGWHVVLSLVPVHAHNSALVSENTNAASDSATAQMHPRQDNRTPSLDHAAYQQQLTLLLRAIEQHTQNHQGFRMVVAQGLSAAAYLDSATTGTTASPNTFIAITPFWPQSDINDNIAGQVANATFPILDISFTEFNAWEQDTAAERKMRAETSLKLHYRQVKLSSNIFNFSLEESNNSQFIQTVAGNIVGWTRYLGW